jgi:hypothetical protein
MVLTRKLEWAIPFVMLMQAARRLPKIFLAPDLCGQGIPQTRTTASNPGLQTSAQGGFELVALPAANSG